MRSLRCWLLSGCGGRVLLCSARFSWRAQAPEHWLRSCGTEAESLRWHVAPSPMRDQTCVLCIGRQVLYHWATREALKKFFYIVVKYMKYEIYHLNHFLILIILFVCFWLCWVLVAVQVFSSCGERGLLCSCGSRLLIAVASLVWSTGSRWAGFRSSGSWALAHRLSSCGTWLPRGLNDKESPHQCRSRKRCRFDPWVENIPWRKKW